MISYIVSFNKLAMENLAQNKLEMALHFMNRADKALESLPDSLEKSSLVLITCNNQACLYKTMGQSHQADLFLTKASKIKPVTPEDYYNLARCLLNLSLLKMEDKDSESALVNSLKALDILTKYCETDTDKYYENLCTALNIIGNQHRFKGNNNEAARVFKRGLDISEEFLGSQHQLTQTFKKYLEHKKYKFTKKPKSSNFSLPRMNNRLLPQPYSSNKQREKTRMSSLEFYSKSKLPPQKYTFAKDTKISMKKDTEFSIDVTRKTQIDFNLNETSPLKINQSERNIKSWDFPCVTIQSVFRKFLAIKLLEKVKDSKLTRRQLAEKKAIIALQEFEVLKVRATKENPYYEHEDFHSVKTHSRKSTGRSSQK
ncbi:hypothetical protein SteCoe_18393 [Stentor coeruleus]|uniref:Uncharacterized protein n=1 Tax=Stentor coeruleus TaxID=5963 RepID=A0A1R2BWH3_9CILI|nr:hypothetical protein SteCoe_18393 [Stentor coeruleus]